MPQPPFRDPREEAAFQQFYRTHAQRWDLDPNPDAPEQAYDYRAAFKAGAEPDASGHWPSQFKKPGHPNMVVGGFHVQTGQRVPGTPCAKSAAELVQLGWDAETAETLAAMPEPTLESRSLGTFGRLQPPPMVQGQSLSVFGRGY